MSSSLLNVLAGLSLLFGAIAGTSLLAHVVRMPVATMQALLGLALGLAVLLLSPFDSAGWLAPLDSVVEGLESLGGTGVLALFLPPLLFDAALRVDTRQLLADSGPVLLLAVVAVILTTAAAAAALVAVDALPLAWALAVAAVVATTDPSAVLAIFRHVGAPKRLQALVEGESLLNDAAAIVLFATVTTAIASMAEPSFTGFAVDFAITAAGGLVIGAVIGSLAAAILERMRHLPDVALTISITVPYLAFVGAEEYAGISGAIAVVIAGLIVGRALRERVPPGLTAQVLALWGQLASWAGALIVVGAMALLPIFLKPDLIHLPLVLLLAVACLTARAVVLWGLLPSLAALKLSEPVDNRYRVAMWWGGLRGAVTVALALTLTADSRFDPELRNTAMLLASGYVLLTLFVQAPTLPLVMRFLKLHGLSNLDEILRDEAVRTVRGKLAERVVELSTALRLDPTYASDVEPTATIKLRSSRYDRRERLAAALAGITEREAAQYRQMLEDGLISSHVAQDLLRGPTLLAEALRTGGLAACAAAAKRELNYTRSFRVALRLHRWFNLHRPLAIQLSLRYERLMVRRAVLLALRRDQHDEDDGGTSETERVDTLLGARLEAHQRALDGLRLQYPSYAEAFERRFLQRAALRVEAEAYGELRHDGLLSGAAYSDLTRRMEARLRESAALPELDLRMTTQSMVERVPLLAGLPAKRLGRVTRALRGRLAIPGEKIVRRGEVGDAMYFIVEGAVEVMLTDGRVRLGTGDFFGEMALLTGRRRSADVVALGYTHLASLSRRDFRNILGASQDLRDTVVEAAERRRREGLVAHKTEKESA